MFTLSEDLSLEALKLLARLRSLLKLRNFFLLESTGGLVRSGESAGMAVFLTGESGGVMGREGRGEREEEVEEGKNDELENDDGERGVEEQVDIESNLSLLACDSLAYSKESVGWVALLSVLTITTTHYTPPHHTAVSG